MYMYNVNFTFFDIVHVHFLIEKCTCTTWQLFYTKAFRTCVTNSALFFFHTVAYESSKTGKEWKIFLSILQTLCLHTEVRYLGYKYDLLRHRSLQRSTAHRFWFSWLQIVHHINNGIILYFLRWTMRKFSRQSSMNHDRQVVEWANQMRSN